MAETLYDVIVVGSGPAGLTAAVYARRAGKTVLVLEKETFGGQITHSPKVENYPGFVEMTGNEFAEKLMEQAMLQGAEIDMGEVVRLQQQPDGSKLLFTAEGGCYRARSVIIAAGSRHRPLGVAREEELVGRGVSYCAVCDGAFYAGRRVTVIGGGNSALQEAVMLAERCSHVTVVQNLAFLTGEQQLVDKLQSMGHVDFIYNSVVEQLLGDRELSGVVIRNTETGALQTIETDAVFVAIGQIPENAPFAEVCSLAENGYIQADESCQSGTPGVFAAGDCRQKTVRQITTATGDGAVAAVAACRYLDSL